MGIRVGAWSRDSRARAQAASSEVGRGPQDFGQKLFWRMSKQRPSEGQSSQRSRSASGADRQLGKGLGWVRPGIGGSETGRAVWRKSLRSGGKVNSNRFWMDSISALERPASKTMPLDWSWVMVDWKSVGDMGVGWIHHRDIGVEVSEFCARGGGGGF